MNTQLFKYFILASLFISSCTSDEHKETARTFSERSPITVSTQKAITQSTNGIAVLSGKIQSKNTANVSAQMMGYITSLDIEVGDRVKAGQRILTIKNNELPAKRAQIDAGISEAKAALKNVKTNYDRMKVLWEQESITRKEWDDISTQYDIVKAKMEGAQSMRNEINEVIALTNVTAPISGIVSSKMINKGDLVNPGIPLMTIEGTKEYEVITHVSDEKIPFIKMGMTLDCEIKSIDKHINAVVSEVAPSAVNTAGQFTVKAKLELNKEDRKVVFPGMYANVYAKLPGQSKASTSILTVPKSALFQRGQLTGLYTLSGQGTAVLRWVRIGQDNGNSVEIVSGLTAGEEYIVSDISRLTDGIPVKK